MTATWHAHEIYDKGLDSFEQLSLEERVIFLLVDLETCAAMEGWDHFFTCDRMPYYDDLKSGLSAAGAQDSLQLLLEYEAVYRKRGIEFEPEAIDDYLCNCSDSEFDRDWLSEYEGLSATRWGAIRKWLSAKNIDLLG